MITQPDETWWMKARQAHALLAARYLDYPDVSLIDIGLDPLGTSDTPVLRVHVRRAGATPPDLPGDVDGIPVRLVRGNYQLQDGGLH
jgi:hypothetical protein